MNYEPHSSTVQVSDTTGDAQRFTAGQQKNLSTYYAQVNCNIIVSKAAAYICGDG